MAESMVTVYFRNGQRAQLSNAERVEVEPFDLFVRAFGDDGPAERLIARTIAWDAVGRPGTDRLGLRAYPADAGYRPAAGEAVVRKRWTDVVVDLAPIR